MSRVSAQSDCGVTASVDAVTAFGRAAKSAFLNLKVV